MAASTRQQVQIPEGEPARIDLSVASGDFRITDAVKSHLLGTMQGYLQDAGYRVHADVRAGMGTSLATIPGVPGVPQVGKIGLWGIKHVLQKRREAQQRSLDELLPKVHVAMFVDGQSVQEQLNPENTLGGIIVHLPSLYERLLREHPPRRYSFRVMAPASKNHRFQTAILTERDFKPSRLLKMIVRSAKPRTKDRSTFQFNPHFPYILEDRILPNPGQELDTRNPGPLPVQGLPADTGQPVHDLAQSEQPSLENRVADLEIALLIERVHRTSAEQVAAAERHRAQTAEMAIRMLEQRPSTPEPASSPVVAASQHEAKPGFWRRILRA